MISAGSTAAAGVYVGGTEATAVYVGSTLVWSADTVPVTRIMHDFTDDAVTSDLEGRALDSGGGYTWRTDPTNAAAVGKVQADSTGRKGYVNANTTVATVQDSHVIATPPLPRTAFYARQTYHVDYAGPGTTDSWRVGCISWFDPLGTAGQGPKSVAHCSMVNTGMFLQEFDVDEPTTNVIQQDTVTYAAPITDSRDLTVEFVIVEADDAVVCKAPDGTFLSLETTNASSWLMNWFDIEIGVKSTDRRVYCTAAAADWLDDHTSDSVIAHANALLAESGLGYGPITRPAVAPDVMSSGVAHTNTITLGSHSAGQKILGFAYRVGSNTPPTMPASQGWTDAGSFGANSASIRLFQKTAASSSELFGTATNGTFVGYVVLDDAASFGTAVFQGASGSTITYPALTRVNTDGRSRGIRIGGHDNAYIHSNIPTGYTLLAENLVAFGGGLMVFADTARGLASNPTSATQTMNASAGNLGVTIEVIPT